MLDYEVILGVRAKKGVSPARLWTARKAYEAELSLYADAKAALGRGIDRVRADQDLKENTAAALRTAQAAVRRAELQLSYTRVYATVSGRVAFNKSKLAQRLRAGEVFLNLVGEPSVVANFNRSQLKRLKRGQQVRIRVGAIQTRTFQGEVASIPPLPGRAAADRMPARRLAAALFPPVQTAPVKIAFDPEGLRGFEDRMDPGLLSSVVVAPE